MNYGSAVEVLGVEDVDSLTRDQLRRVYMRKLRQHPPEKDPEGFKRLREAFEYLREWLPDEAPVKEPAAEAPPAEAPAPAIVVVDLSQGPPLEVAAPVMPEPEPEPDDDGNEDEPEPDEEELRRLREEIQFRVLPRMADLPPLAAAPPAPEPPMRLDRLVETLLVMLQHDEVDAANELAKRWQATGDTDDRRYSSDYIAARWALTRELLVVAGSLPREITSALAKGIAQDDVESARPALADFRSRDHWRATAANEVLKAGAGMLYRQVEGTLFVPPATPPPRVMPRVQIPYTPPPSVRTSRSSGGVWALIVVAIGCLRLCMAVGGPSTHSYSGYTPPKFNIPEYHPPQIDYAALEALSKTPALLPPAPAPFDPTRDRDQQVGEIVQLLVDLEIYSISSPEQKDAATALDAAVIADTCPKQRALLVRLEKSPPPADESHKSRVDEHIAAIRQRLDAVCPQKKRTKKSP